MKGIYKNTAGALCVLMLAFAVTATGYAQGSADVLLIPEGQRMNIEGVILSRDGEVLTVRTFGHAVYRVFVSDFTELRERKSNIFRGAKRYSIDDLVTGLSVEARGIGMTSGMLSAGEIRFRNDDHIVAQTMHARVIPVESDLRSTQIRLGETERNAEVLSGQIEELTAITNIVHNDARAAQATADAAVAAAAGAQFTADSANDRISMIDDFDVASLTMIYFRAGSSALDAEYMAELDMFARRISGERGYLIEVAGFASSDGDAAVNRRLSQQRAEAVIRYLAENYMIPMRRFVTPMGYGESHPVGDNRTREGREENRRVEVRLLVNQGLAAPIEAAGGPAF